MGNFYILAGGSGIPNFGDELIARGWVESIRAHNPAAEILLDCKDSAASEAAIGPLFGVRHVSYLRKMSRGEKPLDFWGSVRRGYDYIRKGGFRRNADAQPFAEAVKKAEVFHIFGGGYINERWPDSGFLLGFAASLNELYGVRVAASGLGLMPLSPPAAWGDLGAFNRTLSRFAIVDVRDSASHQVISNAPGVHARNGLDDTFLAPVRGWADGPATLHIAVSFGKGNAAKFQDVVAHSATVLGPQFDRVLFWRCAPGKDDLALGAFSGLCPGLDVAEVADLVQKPLPVGQRDAMVTTRFHPHLMASRLGIPGYFFVGSEYYRIKHGSVIDLGSAFQPWRLDNPPEGFGFGSDEMVSRDEERVAAKGQVAEMIYGPST